MIRGTYSKDADAVYVELQSKQAISHQYKMSLPNATIVVDCGEDGELIGFEVIGAGTSLSKEFLEGLIAI